VVLERHPDHIGGPARSASIKPIFAIAAPCAIVPFFLRGGALSAHGALVANSIFTLGILRTLAQNELDFCIRHQYQSAGEPPKGCPSILGIGEFIVPTGSFFHAQTHISFHVIEELSPNVRMIL
jgi:hypothetical protein